MAVRVYLAGPWADREKVRAVREQLQQAGIDVQSRWLDKDYDDPIDYDAALDQARLKREALNDLEDVYNADGLVVYHSRVSEGKSFEQGFYLGCTAHTGKKNKIILIEPEPVGHNVFHNLDEVYTKVTSVEAAIEEVKKWQQ